MLILEKENNKLSAENRKLEEKQENVKAKYT